LGPDAGRADTDIMAKIKMAGKKIDSPLCLLGYILKKIKSPLQELKKGTFAYEGRENVLFPFPTLLLYKN
jgi:hypothetical protein